MVWEEMQHIMAEKTRTSDVVTMRPQSGHMEWKEVELDYRT